MEYSIFKELILEALKERFGEECQIEYKEVLKNNGVKLDGVIVRQNNCVVSPTVYVNDYYEDFSDGENINDIADIIERLIRDNTIEDEFDADELILFDNVKDRIVFKLINFERNKELLDTVPYKKYLDLAIVYYISVKEDIFECASILINNSHLKLWNKTLEEIDELAVKNTPFILKPELKSMGQTLKEIMFNSDDNEFNEEDFENCYMYVLTNEKKQFGAATILYDNELKDFSERIESDFYIIPSSVHEVIIIPSKFVDSSDSLDEMICEVNSSQVPLVDILSDHAYKYNRADKCVSLG